MTVIAFTATAIAGLVTGFFCGFWLLVYLGGNSP